MAPEMMMPNCDYDERVDAWSLGILLYTIVTGCLPFQGNYKQIYNKTQFKEPSYKQKSWKQCSPEVQDLTKKLLCKDPNERLSVEDIFDHDWIENDEINVPKKYSGREKRIKRKKLH